MLLLLIFHTNALSKEILIEDTRRVKEYLQSYQEMEVIFKTDGYIIFNSYDYIDCTVFNRSRSDKGNYIGVIDFKNKHFGGHLKENSTFIISSTNKTEVIFDFIAISMDEVTDNAPMFISTYPFDYFKINADQENSNASFAQNKRIQFLYSPTNKTNVSISYNLDAANQFTLAEITENGASRKYNFTGTGDENFIMGGACLFTWEYDEFSLSDLIRIHVNQYPIAANSYHNHVMLLESKMKFNFYPISNDTYREPEDFDEEIEDLMEKYKEEEDYWSYGFIGLICTFVISFLLMVFIIMIVISQKIEEKREREYVNSFHYTDDNADTNIEIDHPITIPSDFHVNPPNPRPRKKQHKVFKRKHSSHELANDRGTALLESTD